MNNKVQIRVVFDRKHQATAGKEGLIQIEVRCNSQRKFISSGIKVRKNQFKTGRIVNHEDQDVLNKKINGQIDTINELVQKFEKQGLEFSLDAMRNQPQENAEKSSFLDFMKQRIQERPIKESTRKQHRKVLNFLKNEYKKIVTFDDLTRPNIIRLDEYLRRKDGIDGKMMQTTIHTYHKVIKIYINDAISQEIINTNPYSGWKDKRGSSRPRTILSIEEIKAIYQYKTNSTLQEKVRDYFIIQCYTGLSYADMMTVDFTNTERVGKDCILKNIRVKTGTPYFIVLLPPVIEILSKYGWKLPHLSYDIYNRWLKAIAVAAGIKKNVSTHIGRHTFATTVALGAGLPIEVISKMLGHTDIGTTQIYAKILPQTVLNGFHKIEESFREKKINMD